MYITVDDIKNEISFDDPININKRNADKGVGLIRASFVFSFYDVKNDDFNIGKTIKVKRGCFTMKDTEKVSSGKVKHDSLIGKSVIHSAISHFNPHTNKILGINNENYIDTLTSKKAFSLKTNKLSTTDNIFNGKPSDILYTGYINKNISFGDIVYFEPKNVQYKKLVNGVTDQFKILLIDGDCDEMSSNFKT